MLNKEECEKALENLRILERKDNFKKWGGQVAPQANCDIVEQLIKEHFELVKKYDELYERHSKILDDVHDYRYETQSMKITIRNLCKHFGVKNEEGLKNIYLCKPYKFEDLHEGMWIWDDENEMFILITFIDKQFKKMHVCLTEYDGFNDEYVNVEYTEYFEEGRFFPVIKAMEYQKEVKDDD